MRYFSLVALALTFAFCSLADAGPFGVFGNRRVSGSCADGSCQVQQSVKVETKVEIKKTAKTTVQVDALAEVNACRAARGLRPFLKCDGLTRAAIRAATHRAIFRIRGHCSGNMGDFQFLPEGFNASAAGCAAWPSELGFGSCCMYEG